MLHVIREVVTQSRDFHQFHQWLRQKTFPAMAPKDLLRPGEQNRVELPAPYATYIEELLKPHTYERVYYTDQNRIEAFSNIDGFMVSWEAPEWARELEDYLTDRMQETKGRWVPSAMDAMNFIIKKCNLSPFAKSA